MGDNRRERKHTADFAVELKAAAGRSSGTDSMEPPKPAREQWQQTCVTDALQYTIASGSCCCSPLEGSRSFAGYRTEKPDATAHSMAVRRG